MLTLLAIAALGAAAQTSDYAQGIALFERGKLEEAADHLMRAASGNPADAKAWKALGVVYAAGGRYDAAEPAFGKACDLAPRLEDACYYHARALYALNRFESSLAAMERAAAVGGGWKVELGKAQALEGLGRAAEAEPLFRKAISQSRGADPSPAVALGLFLIRQGRFEDAAATLEGVLKSFPNSAEAHMHLGRALLERGDVPGAIAHLERAIALMPGAAQAHLLLGKAYVRAGREADARAHFEAAAQGVR